MDDLPSVVVAVILHIIYIYIYIGCALFHFSAPQVSSLTLYNTNSLYIGCGAEFYLS